MLHLYSIAFSSSVIFTLCYNFLSPYLSGLLVPCYTNLSHKNRTDWNSRICSTIHAVLVLIPCVYALLYEDEINIDPVWGKSPTAPPVLAFVLGYMITDLIIIVKNHKDIGELGYYIHHIECIIACAYTMTYDVFLWISQYRLLAEISTPFVNLRWFLDAVEYGRNTKLFYFNGIAMALVFYIIRIVGAIPYYLRLYDISTTFDYSHGGRAWVTLILASIVVDCVNLFWAYKMFSGIKKLLCGSSQKKVKTT